MADFKKLDVWQKARELAVNTIQACDEMAGATASIVRNQLVRAVMSVPSNIAEGSAKKATANSRGFYESASALLLKQKTIS